MTNEDFKRLKPGNIITTVSGVNKFMVTHSLVNETGETVAVSLERAAQLVDATGYVIVEQDQLKSCICESTIPGTGE